MKINKILWASALAFAALAPAHATNYRMQQFSPGMIGPAGGAGSQQASAPASCSWNGGTLADGATATAYNGSVTTSSACSTALVTQSCSNGALAYPSATASCVVADPYIAGVSLLMHFDSDFTPAIGPAPTVTNAVIDTGVSKFGGGSAYFNGTSASLTWGSGSVTNLGTGDFTIEGWAMRDSTAGSGSVAYYGNYYAEHTINAYLSGGTAIEMGTCTALSTGCAYYGSVTMTAATWYHWAIVRQSGTLSFYFNGSKVGGTADASNFATGYGLRIGSGDSANATYTPAYFFKGHIDEVRLTIGTARYTANFTPPSESFASR